MSWWKRSKCGTCKKVLRKGKPIHELRIGTAEGYHEVEICEDCARFWDASGEVLNKGRKEDEPVDEDEDNE